LILLKGKSSYKFNFDHPVYIQYFQELNKQYGKVKRHKRHPNLLHSLGNIREVNGKILIDYCMPNKQKSGRDITFVFDGANWSYQKMN
jgi:hypothetical protein